MTPQPTSHLSPHSDDILVGTTERLSSLRGQCLIRDRHRCVISRQFDEVEAIKRYDTYGVDAVDGDEQLLEGDETGYLDLAHIIPHVLTSSDGAKVLDMFDPGILHLIEGANIDQPYNAITLTRAFHRRFGNLQIYFEATPGVDNSYTIKSTLPPFLGLRPRLPISRALFITPERTIDPPMPRLLAIHRACCLILHMNGAGKYIDKVLWDREEVLTAMSDNSTEISSLVPLGLFGS